MEILIDVPIYLQPYIKIIVQYWSYCSIAFHSIQHHVILLYNYLVQLSIQWPSPSSYTSNVIVPIVAIVLVFWPILLSIIVTCITGWAWIVWLITSIVLGCIQMIYACYQFIMISFDICGLSILKTYAMLRHQQVVSRLLYYLHKKKRFTTSRRRLWRQRLEEAQNYEDFLKIRIEPKDTNTTAVTSSNSNSNRTNQDLNRETKSSNIGGHEHHDTTTSQLASSSTTSSEGDRSGLVVDTALPIVGKSRMIGRSNSFTTTSRSSFKIGDNDNDDESELISPSKLMARNLSFSGDIRSNNTNHYNDATSTILYHDPVTIQELGRKTADLLVSTTNRLERARLLCLDNPDNIDAFSTMQYLLVGVVKRNHLQLDELLVQNARSIAEMGCYGLSKRTRLIIKSYYTAVEKCLDYITNSSLPTQTNQHSQQFLDHTNRSDNIPEHPINESPQPQQRIYTQPVPYHNHHHVPHGDLYDRITLLRKMKQNMGRTALMLSGGGAQAMYHLGVIKALIESKLYDDIKVISGTSGGSITAAMCAIKTADELHSDVCVNTVSTDFMLTGEMKRLNIRWFPSMYDMATYWLKHKLLVDSAYFGRTCEFYFKDTTFEEAFIRTGKHVCISVSASRASGTTAQRLLLNHISTPHVTIASAVRASCALPGVMAPAKLVVKSSNGVLEPFEVDGVEWIDGSVQADLPFQRIATLFSITSFIVSQTNFHVVPFLNKEHHPDQKSFYWKLFQTIEWDIRSRALKLSRLGLFPRIFGQDVSKVFKQKYHGNLTIVPRFTTMQTFGLKALSNPTVKDMDGYLKYSQIATWPYLNAIRDMIRLEKALDDCLARLEGRIRTMNPESDWSTHDEIESIESSSIVAASSSIHRVRIVERPLLPSNSNAENLRRKVNSLELENEKLREELAKLQSKAMVHPKSEDSDRECIPNTISAEKVSVGNGSEGEVWNLVRKSDALEFT